MTEKVLSDQTVEIGMQAVEDLDQFVGMLSHWHAHQVATLQHLSNAPEGIGIRIGDDEGTVEERILEGDYQKGFKLGIQLALNYLGTLPFVAEYDDAVDEAPAVAH